MPHLINILPTKVFQSHTSYFAPHGVHPTYTHLRSFCCACYPNVSSIAPHKLAPSFVLCVFLSYPLDHKGWCLDLSSNCVIISRHVVFDDSFPFFGLQASSSQNDLDFLTNFEMPLAPLSPANTAPPPVRSPLVAPSL